MESRRHKRHSFGEIAVPRSQSEAVREEPEEPFVNLASTERRYADLERQTGNAAALPATEVNDIEALYARQKAAVMELLSDPHVKLSSLSDVDDVIRGVMDTSIKLGEDWLRVRLESDPDFREFRELVQRRVHEEESQQVRSYVDALLEVGYLNLSEIKREVKEFGENQLNSQGYGGNIAILRLNELLHTQGFFTAYLDAVSQQIPSAEMKTLVEGPIQSGDWRQVVSAWAEAPKSVAALPDEVKQALEFFIERLVTKEAEGLKTDGQLMYWQVPIEKRLPVVESMRQFGRLIERSLPDVAKLLNRLADEVGKEDVTESDEKKLKFFENLEKLRSNHSEGVIEILPALDTEERERYAKLLRALLQKRQWHKLQLPRFLRYRGEIPDLESAKRVADAAMEEIVATRMPDDIGYEERDVFLREQMTQVSELFSQLSGGDISYVDIEDYLKGKWFKEDQPVAKAAA